MSPGARSPRVFLKGEETTWSEEAEDYVDWQVAKVRCDSYEQAQDVGKVVSLLNDHGAEEIVEAVEGSEA